MASARRCASVSCSAVATPAAPPPATPRRRPVPRAAAGRAHQRAPRPRRRRAAPAGRDRALQQRARRSGAPARPAPGRRAGRRATTTPRRSRVADTASTIAPTSAAFWRAPTIDASWRTNAARDADAVASTRESVAQQRVDERRRLSGPRAERRPLHPQVVEVREEQRAARRRGVRRRQRPERAEDDEADARVGVVHHARRGGWRATSTSGGAAPRGGRRSRARRAWRRRSADAIEASSSAPRPSSVQSACTPCERRRRLAAIARSGAIASRDCRSTSRRCAVRRHHRFGLSSARDQVGIARRSQARRAPAATQAASARTTR